LLKNPPSDINLKYLQQKALHIIRKNLRTAVLDKVIEDFGEIYTLKARIEYHKTFLVIVPVGQTEQLKLQIIKDIISRLK